jgi:hypothetical protein
MDQNIDLLLAILPDDNGSLYGNVMIEDIISSLLLHICHA